MNNLCHHRWQPWQPTLFSLYLWFFFLNLSLVPSPLFLSPSALTGVPSTFTMVWTIIMIRFEDYG